jgi:hypothetical protein
MNLFFATARNVVALRHFESPHRFKTLPRSANSAAGFREGEDVFSGCGAESFSLRETGHDVSLTGFAAPTVLETSAV